MAQFNFDLPSFGAGFGAGILASVAGYRAWQYINQLGSKDETAVVRTYATGAADNGYLKALVGYAQQQHLFGHRISLRDILIEPRFIPAPELVKMPDDDDPSVNVFESLPLVHDYPYFYAPFNIHTLSIDDISRGANILTMIGLPGSGRTTALLTIALWSAGFLEFTPPPDPIQSQINQQDEALSGRERTDRIKKRVALAERARDRYSETNKIDGGSKLLGEKDSASSRFRQIAPVYIHLANIINTFGDYGKRVDPAEPLVRGLQLQTSGIAAKRLVGSTYKLLESGSALVLIDGFDDLPVQDRPAAVRWLKAFINTYRDNFIIIAMPPEGYGFLTESGALPIYLRPWHDQHIQDHIANTVQHFSTLSTRPIQFDQQVHADASAFYTDIMLSSRGLNVHDLTLRTYSRLAGDDANQSEQMHAYLRDLFPDADNLLPELSRLATLQLDHGYITIRNLIEQITAETTGRSAETPAPASVQAAAPAEMDQGSSEYDEFFSRDTSAQQPTAPEPVQAQKEEITEISKEYRKLAQEQNKLLAQLVKTGLIVRFRGGRYQFRHSMMAAYLGALSLADADQEIVQQKHANPQWEHAFCYLTQHRDLDFLVPQQILQEHGLLYSPLLKLTNWLKYAGKEVTWRANLMRYLGNMLVIPNQFTLLRERIAAALVNTRDDGSVVIFRKALQSRNADVRKLGCLGVGIMRDETPLDALAQIVVQDPIPEIKIAASLGLAAMGTDAALQTLVDVIEVSPDKDVRRAVAESLAANREIGYPTLYDALKAQEMMIRRAAVFGLGRIRTDWSLIALNEIFLEDPEWYVRSAAQVVFQEMFEQSISGLDNYPPVTEVPWLLSWSREQMEAGNIPFDMKDEPLFQHALQQKTDPLARLLATLTVGQVGEYGYTDRLYGLLSDPEEVIRDAAYRSLGEFQQRLGVQLPIPTI